MKKYGTVIALGFAVLFGTTAVWLSHQWLTTKTTAGQAQIVIPEQVPTTAIVVAAKDLNIGQMLNTESLTLARWPKSSVPRGAFEDLNAVAGRVTVSKMVAGEPVLAAELAAPGSGVGLVALIPEGKRAMSIRVDEVIGVAGFILPNTYVDVIAVGNPVSGQKKAVKTILERIKVLAIAQETFTEEGKAKVVRTVTMVLEKTEAEKLALQTHQAAIHLVLRNPSEEIAKKVSKRRVTSLRPRIRTPKPATFEVQVVKGEQPPVNYQFKSSVVK